MTPGTYDITIYRGGTFHINLTATDTDGEIDFSATYTAARMCIQPAWLTSSDDMPETPLFELSTHNGLITIGGKILTLQIPSAVTRSLSFVEGIYSLKLIADEIPDATVITDTLIMNDNTVLYDGSPLPLNQLSINAIEDIFLQGQVMVKNGPTP